MTTKMVYVAKDGTIFNNEKDCLNYEARETISKDTAVKIAKELQEFCASRGECRGCPFCVGYDCRLTKVPDLWGLN